MQLITAALRVATLFALGACGHSEMVDAPHPCDPTMQTDVAVS